MPLFTGSSATTGSAVFGGTGGALGQKAWFVTRWILRRTPHALVVTAIGNAIYYGLRALNSNNDADQVAGVGGVGGPVASIQMPPMWARDP